VEQLALHAFMTKGEHNAGRIGAQHNGIDTGEPVRSLTGVVHCGRGFHGMSFAKPRKIARAGQAGKRFR
jgi:hypothetical protein